MSHPENATPNAMADQQAAPAPATETPAVETPEAPAVEVPEAEQIADPAPAEEVIEKPEQSKAVKELIAQRKKRQLAEQEAAYWKGVAEANQRKEQDTQPPKDMPVVSNDGAPIEPNPRNFEDYDAYDRAKDAYLVNLAKYQFKMEMEQDKIKKQQAVVRETFQQRITKAIDEDPDFAEVLQDKTLPVNPVMLEIIQESEVAPELLRWINDNRKDAEVLYYMSPIQMAKQLGVIEAKLKTPKPQPQPPKKVSQAPEPIPTLTPAGQAVPDEDNMSMEEYHRRRTQALFKR